MKTGGGKKIAKKATTSATPTVAGEPAGSRARLQRPAKTSEAQADLRRELTARVLDIPDLEVRKSRHSSEEAIYVDKREIAHFHSDREIDVRVTRAQIKKIGLLKSGDPRVSSERPNSEWVVVSFTREEDLSFVVDLCEIAARANRVH